MMKGLVGSGVVKKPDTGLCTEPPGSEFEPSWSSKQKFGERQWQNKARLTNTSMENNNSKKKYGLGLGCLTGSNLAKKIQGPIGVFDGKNPKNG